MKKLFRFKYEPCNGTCYAPEDVFFSQMKQIQQNEKLKIIEKIVTAHDKMCDNPSYSFGLDMCEKTNLFIGHFNQPDRLDVFTGVTLQECIDDMTSYILKTTIPRVDGFCNYGNHGIENLKQQILSASF